MPLRRVRSCITSHHQEHDRTEQPTWQRHGASYNNADTLGADCWNPSQFCARVTADAYHMQPVANKE
jgi:hypothetical protein